MPERQGTALAPTPSGGRFLLGRQEADTADHEGVCHAVARDYSGRAGDDGAGIDPDRGPDNRRPRGGVIAGGAGRGALAGFLSGTIGSIVAAAFLAGTGGLLGGICAGLPGVAVGGMTGAIIGGGIFISTLYLGLLGLVGGILGGLIRRRKTA